MGSYVLASLILFFLSYTLDLLCGFNFFSTIFSWVKRKIYIEPRQNKEKRERKKIEESESRNKVLCLAQNNSYEIDFIINQIQEERLVLNEFELTYLDELLPYSSERVKKIIQQNKKEIGHGF